MSWRYHRTSPDNHSIDTLLLSEPTVWISESHLNLCILFEQYISAAYTSRLEFQFLSVRRSRQQASARLSFVSNQHLLEYYSPYLKENTILHHYKDKLSNSV
jgi:hypothetical protein